MGGRMFPWGSGEASGSDYGSGSINRAVSEELEPVRETTDGLRPRVFTARKDEYITGSRRAFYSTPRHQPCVSGGSAELHMSASSTRNAPTRNGGPEAHSQLNQLLAWRSARSIFLFKNDMLEETYSFKVLPDNPLPPHRLTRHEHPVERRLLHPRSPAATVRLIAPRLENARARPGGVDARRGKGRPDACTGIMKSINFTKFSIS